MAYSGPVNDSPDAPRCPRCGRRGSSRDWALFGRCPHRCGFQLPPPSPAERLRAIERGKR